MQDSRERLQLTTRDWLTFEVIQRHGPLPSNYLFELSRAVGNDRCFFRKRLLKLVRYGYLERPEELNNPSVRDDFKMYVLTDKSKQALKETGRLHQFAKPVGGGYFHMALAACVTASIELEATRAGYRYISQEEILAKAPEATRTSERPLELPCVISHTFHTSRGSYAS